MTSGVSGSGLDVGSLVSQLVALERAPAARYNASRLAALSRQTAWGDIAAKLAALRTAAQALDTPREVASAKASSTDTTRVSATASSSAVPGSTSLEVLRLATTEQRTSTGLAGSAQLVGAGQMSVSSGLAALGLTAASPDATLAAGKHTIAVHPPTAAVVTGTGGPALDHTATDLRVTLADGTATDLVLQASYADVDALAADLGRQLGSTATVSVKDGALVLTGTATGSASSLTVSGGAAAALGLPTTTARGTDHTASLDGGPAVALVPGGSVTLQAPAAADGTAGGTLTLTAGTTGLSAGTASTTLVRTTDTSTVADVVSALNATGSPVSAALLDTGDGTTTSHRLVLTAAASGTRGALALSTDLASLDSLTDPANTRAAVDAQVKVGALTLTRSSNTVDDVLPGVTLDLLSTGTTTVTVTRDTEAMATRAKGLVDALNALITSVGTQTRPGVDGAKGGPLASSGQARGVMSAVRAETLTAVGTSTTAALSQIGITVERTGSYRFDEAAFTAAVGRDADGVGALVSSLATGLARTADTLTGTDGVVTSAGRTAGAEAAQRQAQIDRLDLRLETVERRYRAQYAKLDAAMAVLQQQAGRLASQIGGLPTWSS